MRATSCTNQVEQLQAALTNAGSAQAEQESASAALEAAQAQVLTLEAQVQELGSQLETARSEVAGLREALEASESDRDKLKAQLARLKQQMIREQVRVYARGRGGVRCDSTGMPSAPCTWCLKVYVPVVRRRMRTRS